MWQLFVAVYLSYLFLGPHWVSHLITGKQLRLVDSPKTLARRSVYISYVSLLYTAWFLYAPSAMTFVYAALLSMAATMAFYTQYGPEDPLPMHLFLNFAVLMMGRDYANEQFFLTMLLVIFYPLTRNILYDIQ
jgi:uncharacterized membrane protein